MKSIGIDVADLSFTASCVDADFRVIFFGRRFKQSPEGYQTFLEYVETQAVSPFKIIMENTGVYSERLSYFLYKQGFSVFVEPPLQVHNAFYEEGKSDPVDSREIAEYGFRYKDRLHPWQPPDQIVEQISMLLTSREQLTKVKAGAKNTLKSLKRKYNTYEGVVSIYETLVAECDQKIEKTIADIRAIIKTNPDLQRKVDDVLSIKNVGIVLTAYLLVCSKGFTVTKYQTLARFAGIVPFPHESGTSIKRSDTSRGVGPKLLRKNLYLCAMRMRKDNEDVRKYFERKVAEGKKPRVVINNIENKILRLVCGVLKSGKPYIKNYRLPKPE